MNLSKKHDGISTIIVPPNKLLLPTPGKPFNHSSLPRKELTMTEADADILARIKLYSQNEGARELPTPPDRFGCIFKFADENFECLLLLSGIGSLSPGFEGTVPIAFLQPQNIKSNLKIGSYFILREYKIIGTGIVEKICSDT